MRELVIYTYVHVRGLAWDFPRYVEVNVLVSTVVKASLFFPIQEVAELQQQLQSSTQQLQSSEREKEMYRQQLMRKEAELTRAEETIRREQQQIQEMRQQVSLVTVSLHVVCVVTRGPPDQLSQVKFARIIGRIM